MENMTQGTKEWLNWRNRGLGSSDVPIIMGESPYKTVQELWEEKILNEVVENKSNYILDLGHKFEIVARAQFELMNQCDFSPQTIEHRDYPFLRASLDGINWDEGKILEIKMVGKKDLEEIKTTGIPLQKHYGQIQHQLMLTDFDQGYYFCYTLTADKKEIEDTVVISVNRDDSYVSRMLPRLLWFWECVQTKTNPVQGDLSIAEQYVQTKLEIENLTEKLDTLKSLILSMSSEQKYTIGKVRVSRSFRKGNVDYKKIPQLEGIDLDQYRGPDSETVRIDIV